MTCGDFGGITTTGRPCLRTAGWGTGTGTGRCTTHIERDEPLPTGGAETCGDYGGIAKSTGRPCKRPAGWGFADEDTGPCRPHRKDPQPDTPPPAEDPGIPEPPIIIGDSEPEWDLIIEDQTLEGDVALPAEAKWRIGANVIINRGSLIIVPESVCGMRPGAHLTFNGGIPTEYVGGGNTWDQSRALDFGLWAMQYGVLDIQGTPKQRWNRTGTHASWGIDDELYISPTALDDLVPNRWYPGDPIPQIDPRVPPAEIGNVTSDILIDGTCFHIHIHAHEPFDIQYLTVRGGGVQRPAVGSVDGGPVLGRYAFHVHHGGAATAGSILRGLAAVDCKSRVFVPHGVNGITAEDILVVNSWGEALWWDMDRADDRSNDLMIDRLCVMGVSPPRSYTGKTPQTACIELPGGTGNTMKNSAVSGSRGSQISRGFNWSSAADSFGKAIWTFEEGNVAHNNQSSGLRFWNNNLDQHVTKNVITYRNGRGIENGAYANANFFEDCLGVEDNLFAQASGRHKIRDDFSSPPQTYRRMDFPALVIGHIRLYHLGIGQLFDDCDFGEVRLNGDQRLPWYAKFTNTRIAGEPMEPGDIQWPEPMPADLEGSYVKIEGPSGDWEIRVTAGAVVVVEV